MHKLRLFFLLLLASSFIACADASTDQTPLAQLPPATAPLIPPTFTPAPPSSLFDAIPVVTVTQAPLATVVTSTPIPFGADVVELRLTIPSIGLDRRLQGSVSSQIVLVDESNGFAVQRDNQAGVLLDLQQVLPQLVLADLPADCDSCVNLSYNLPFSNVQADGWLRDPVLLASLENYFTTSLGPHFPPETIIGLRRSASPYAPAHTAAVLADGRLFRWLANADEAAPATTASPMLLTAFEALELAGVAPQYTAPCPGTPLETLLLAGRESERLITLVCPEFALSANLQPLYVALDEALAELLASSETVLVRPPAAFPLDAVLDYQRLDNSRLTIFMDGTAVALGSSQPVTSTLSSSQVISLTTNLLASGVLRTGLTTFVSPETAVGTTEATATPASPRTLLLVRGPAAVYDAQWFNTANVPLLAELNELLSEMLLAGTVVPEFPDDSPPEIVTAAPENATSSPTPIPADE